jgi:hypothetical protein
MFSAIVMTAVSLLSQSGVETKYDRFRDSTSYRMDIAKAVSDDDTHTCSIHAHHRGEEKKALKDTDSIMLMVYHYGPRWLYLRDHDVIVMEGRTKFDIEQSYRGELDKKGDGVDEFIHITMSITEAKVRLKSDKDWEIKIGLEEPRSLGRIERKKIAQFIAFIQEP